MTRKPGVISLASRAVRVVEPAAFLMTRRMILGLKSAPKRSRQRAVTARRTRPN